MFAVLMKRRDFCKYAAVASGSVARIGWGSSGKPEGSADGDRTAGERRRSFVLGTPLTHSDWMLKPGIKWGEDGVKHMLDACRAAGWSRIYWRVFDGGRGLFRSKLLRPQGKWDEGGYWDPKSPEDRALQERFTAGMNPGQRAALREKLEALDYAGFDSLAAAVEYGHKIGLQIHAWLTINEDDHGWGIQSDFSKKHPEFRWKRRDGRMYRSQLSFAFEAVRDYKLALVDEMLDYEIDGLFFDWIRTGDVRDNPQTDADGVLDSGYEEPLIRAFREKFGIDPHELPNGDERWVQFRAEPQTEFMRAVRRLLRRRRPELALAAMVAHPWLYRGELDRIDGNLRGLFLDVTTWAQEGLVDSIVAAGYYRDGGNGEMAWQALRKETQGKIDVWIYAWVPRTVAEVQQAFALAGKVGAPEILFWEADYIDDRANREELGTAMKAG